VVASYFPFEQKKLLPDKSGGLLIVLGPVTRNSDIYGLLGDQSNSSYFGYIETLINLLPKHIVAQSLVRPKNASSIGKPARISVKQIAELLGNSIKIDNGTFGLNETQSQNRLSIVSYNQTTIPTNLLAGFPTVAMWDQNYVRLTSTATIIYNELFKAKILHYSPESAAQHIADIWENVDLWWTSKEVLQARETFCENFARHSKFPALEVAKALADYR
jgi:putative transferase (TIGR04331 family)